MECLIVSLFFVTNLQNSCTKTKKFHSFKGLDEDPNIRTIRVNNVRKWFVAIKKFMIIIQLQYDFDTILYNTILTSSNQLKINEVEA